MRRSKTTKKCIRLQVFLSVLAMSQEMVTYKEGKHETLRGKT